MANNISKDIDLGITRLEYGESDRPQRAVLAIATRKHFNGGLISVASVYWIGEHSRQQAIGMGRGGGDYGKTLKTSARDMKATQRKIDAQHAEVFTDSAVAELMEAAKAHYADVVRAGVDGYKNTYLAEPVHA